jgi:hypothetical protein
MRSRIFALLPALALLCALAPATTDAKQKAAEFKGLYHTKFTAGSQSDGLSRTYRFDDIEISGAGRISGSGTVVEKGKKAKQTFPAQVRMSGKLRNVAKLKNGAGELIGLYSTFKIKLDDGTTIQGKAKIYFGPDPDLTRTPPVDANGVATTLAAGSTNMKLARTFPPAN